MRPTAQSLFLASPIAHEVDAPSPPTVPMLGVSPRASSVVPTAWYEPAEPRLWPLGELDTFLAARVLRFEITGANAEDALLLCEVRSLRSALRRAAVHAEDAVPGSQTFESALAQTLRDVYAWAFAELDAIFLYEVARPLPKRLVGELVDHADVAAVRTQLNPALADLEGALIELAKHCVKIGRR